MKALRPSNSGSATRRKNKPYLNRYTRGCKVVEQTGQAIHFSRRHVAGSQSASQYLLSPGVLPHKLTQLLRNVVPHLIPWVGQRLIILCSSVGIRQYVVGVRQLNEGACAAGVVHLIGVHVQRRVTVGLLDVLPSGATADAEQVVASRAASTSTQPGCATKRTPSSSSGESNVTRALCRILVCACAAKRSEWVQRPPQPPRHCGCGWPVLQAALSREAPSCMRNAPAAPTPACCSRAHRSQGMSGVAISLQRSRQPGYVIIIITSKLQRAYSPKT
eukprot:scaffold1086_cov397-Prasinococcus_capsulatus_cf.AAC.4